MRMSSSFDSFDVLNVAICGDVASFTTGYLRLGLALMFGIEALPCYDVSEVAEVMLADEDFGADLLSTPLRYFEVEIFSG